LQPPPFITFKLARIASTLFGTGFSCLISGLLEKRCSEGHFLLPFVKKMSARLKVPGRKRKEGQPYVTEMGRSNLLREDPEAVPLCGLRPE